MELSTAATGHGSVETGRHLSIQHGSDEFLSDDNGYMTTLSSNCSEHSDWQPCLSKKKGKNNSSARSGKGSITPQSTTMKKGVPPKNAATGAGVEKKAHKRPTNRNIVRWNGRLLFISLFCITRTCPYMQNYWLSCWAEDLDRTLLLAIQHECERNNVTLPWAKIAQHISETTTEGAVKQHLHKLRQRRVKARYATPRVQTGGASEHCQALKSAFFPSFSILHTNNLLIYIAEDASISATKTAHVQDKPKKPGSIKLVAKAQDKKSNKHSLRANEDEQVIPTSDPGSIPQMDPVQQYAMLLANNINKPQIAASGLHDNIQPATPQPIHAHSVPSRPLNYNPWATPQAVFTPQALSHWDSQPLPNTNLPLDGGLSNSRGNNYGQMSFNRPSPSYNSYMQEPYTPQSTLPLSEPLYVGHQLGFSNLSHPNNTFSANNADIGPDVGPAIDSIHPQETFCGPQSALDHCNLETIGNDNSDPHADEDHVHHRAFELLAQYENAGADDFFDWQR